MTDHPASAYAALAQGISRGHDIGILARLAPQPGGAGRTWRADPLTVCDYLAAELPDSRSSWCEIADVIICPGGPRPTGAAARLARVLRRYPGCAVAVGVAGGGSFVVAARCGSMISLSAPGPSGECSWRALTCGSIAYAWLCAGRSLSGLDQLTIRMLAGQPLDGGDPSCSGTWSCWLWESGNCGSRW